MSRAFMMVERYIGGTDGKLLQDFFAEFCREQAARGAVVRVTFEVEYELTEDGVVAATARVQGGQP